MTINEFLYEFNKLSNEMNICGFRELEKKYNLNVNKDEPIIIGNYINHIKQFDFLQMSGKTNSFRKDKSEIKS